MSLIHRVGMKLTILSEAQSLTMHKVQALPRFLMIILQ